MSQQPSVGRIVHYVSHGTPPRPDGSQEFRSECRAAVIAGVPNPKDPSVLQLCVLNPTGLFFNEVCRHNKGAETPGSSDCPNAATHGNPFRYCSCGWMEASLVGGTWHWPENAFLSPA